MKSTYFVLLGSVLLAGCSESYRQLEDRFAIEALAGEPDISHTSMRISGPNQRGASNYRGIVDIHVSSGAIGVAVAAPFHKAILIPAGSVSACGMTCFGMSDRWVELMITSTGSVLSFPSNQRLLDWCWATRKPVYPGDIERSWKYHGSTLPARDLDDPQFSSPDAYDNALLNNCRGI